MFGRLTNMLDNAVKLGIPGCDCVVYHKGKCVYRYFTGVSSLEEKTPVNGKEFYNIYSSSKLITCVAAMQLWEKRMFDLEDDLCKYMPEFTNMTVKKEDGSVVPAKNRIKIKHLFSMSSGLDYNCASDGINRAKEETNGVCPTREVMKYIATEPLEFEPGEKWRYSLAHDVLAALVEVLTGKTFGEYVKENIFEPAGMENTTFLFDESEFYKLAEQYRYHAESNEELNKLDPEADKYRSNGGFVNVGKHVQTYKFGTKYESGGAGAISTTDDYIKLLEAIRTGLLIKPETLALMSTNCFKDEQLELFWEKENGYGYGLGFKCPPECSHLTNVGWGGAAGAHWFIDTKNEITMCYHQHVLSSPKVGLGDNLTIVTTEIILKGE